MGGRISVPPKSAAMLSTCFWAWPSVDSEYDWDFFHRNEWSEPNEQMLNLTPRGRDLRKTAREDRRAFILSFMLQDRLATNTIEGWSTDGSVKLGTRVTINAFECGMVG